MSRKLFTIADYMNAELGTPNFEHETRRFDKLSDRNFERQTPNIELEPGTPNAKPGTLNLEP